ncbi:hypothetical protein NPIL_294051 [Nephila pilipes]|uniref:Uncharacterized protein n=1 Tax=Nephila pilipes TaxID=299642 RepID=A0A8X6PPL9_NEPPI|nr:hypothetical protein NPIL_294051 [Nephila pilipes]
MPDITFLPASSICEAPSRKPKAPNLPWIVSNTLSVFQLTPEPNLSKFFELEILTIKPGNPDKGSFLQSDTTRPSKHLPAASLQAGRRAVACMAIKEEQGGNGTANRNDCNAGERRMAQMRIRNGKRRTVTSDMVIPGEPETGAGTGYSSYGTGAGYLVPDS